MGMKVPNLRRNDKTVEDLEGVGKTDHRPHLFRNPCISFPAQYSHTGSQRCLQGRLGSLDFGKKKTDDAEKLKASASRRWQLNDRR